MPLKAWVHASDHVPAEAWWVFVSHTESGDRLIIFWGKERKLIQLNSVLIVWGASAITWVMFT